MHVLIGVRYNLCPSALQIQSFFCVTAQLNLNIRWELPHNEKVYPTTTQTRVTIGDIPSQFHPPENKDSLFCEKG
jgi:hypothetical protein